MSHKNKNIKFPVSNLADHQFKVVFFIQLWLRDACFSTKSRNKTNVLLSSLCLCSRSRLGRFPDGVGRWAQTPTLSPLQPGTRYQKPLSVKLKHNKHTSVIWKLRKHNSETDFISFRESNQQHLYDSWVFIISATLPMRINYLNLYLWEKSQLYISTF